jgi:hypothetical protein
MLRFIFDHQPEGARREALRPLGIPGVSSRVVQTAPPIHVIPARMTPIMLVQA